MKIYTEETQLSDFATRIIKYITRPATNEELYEDNIRSVFNRTRVKQIISSSLLFNINGKRELYEFVNNQIVKTVL